MADLTFSVELGDIREFDSNVVALMYAQDFYGPALEVALKLAAQGVSEVRRLELEPDQYALIETRGVISADFALFIGLPRLEELDYSSIRRFGSQAIAVLHERGLSVARLGMTIHGPGFGLDEVEAFFAQFAGCNEAISRLGVPATLRHVAFVEINRGRVARFGSALNQALRQAEYSSQSSGQSEWNWSLDLDEPLPYRKDTTRPSQLLPGLASDEKAHVFVAMPFAEEFEDVFYFGIQDPVRDSGFVCERVDQESFTGDIFDQVRRKIEGAAVVVAELSTANANVYLEVGYAWGRGRPTILVAREADELLFDVRGQRCLKYRSIKQLKEKLTSELEGLQAKGLI